MTSFPVFVGWDSRETIAYDICVFSIRKYCLQAQIHPLKHEELRARGMFTREWYRKDHQGYDALDNQPFSTEFSYTRFLVPVLQNYQGWAISMDCDMLARADLSKLYALADDRYAVQVVKCSHVPDAATKMDGMIQTCYPRKNWSSLILWNCAHPANRVITKEYVSTASGLQLHQFAWLQDGLIGELPAEWNWIEGVSDPHIEPKIIHYTHGGPWFEQHQHVQYADWWNGDYKEWLAGQANQIP